MYYNFDVAGKELKVFYSEFINPRENTSGTVSVYKNENGRCKEFIRTVRLDHNGREFFTWNHNKIYMDSFKAMTPEELIKKSKYVCLRSENICHTLMRYGRDSIKIQILTKKKEVFDFGGFVISFTTRSNMDKPSDFSWVDYEVVDDYDSIKQCYKLTLKPVSDEDKEMYPTERFYISDLLSLIHKNKDYKFKED